MQKLIQTLILFTLLNSCTSTKNYSNRKDADNSLQDAVQKLNKNPGDESNRKSLPGLYADVQHLHLSNIKKFKAENKESSPHWNDIILEYQALQNAYNTITNSQAAFKIVQPKDYNINIKETKEAAADHFYQQALSMLEKSGRSNAKKAYTYFNISDYYVPGYKDVKSKINIAYEKEVINIVIDSLSDNAFFLNSKWGRWGYDLSNEFFQKKLTADLENAPPDSEYPVAFYREDEAKEKNIRIDWMIYLNLMGMDVHRSMSNTINYSTPPPASHENNLVTFIRPNGAQIITGPDPEPPATFGSNDVFTYPQPIAAVNNTGYNYTTYISSIKTKISVAIKNIATEKIINFKTLNDKNQLHPNSDYYDDGLSQTRFSNLHNPDERELGLILESIYGKVYLQIKDNISIALNQDH